ncbi:tetratricopeptide repeat protein [Azospirillum sp.]|uniref:tetratricopeptide repeat protein n=1 Tax=Azospirillum sp. TaxID=34012 RepID=UPI002D523D90|nr:tetratricopeptide repeat protein [Azospirillum sp.]HYD71239.1 tetratricopeptide repeat protein [Azospirillum sp.]
MNSVERRAAEALTKGDARSALRLVGEALAGGSIAAETANLAGRALLRLDRLGPAARAFRTAAALAPDTPGPFANLASALRRAGLAAEGRRVLDWAVRLAPEDARLRFNVANLLLDDGDKEAAARGLRIALILLPDLAEGLCNLATLQERPADALRSAARAVRCRPVYAEALAILATAANDAGRYGLAAAAARDAITVAPERFTSYAAMAAMQLRQDRFADAEAAARRAVTAAPERGEAWLPLATVLLRRSHLGPALAAAVRAVCLEPERAASWEMLASLHAVRHGNLAAAGFRRAVVLDPGLAGSWLGLSTAHLLPVYGEDDDIAAHLSAYEATLREARARLLALPRRAQAAAAAEVDRYLPFYLPYVQGNDRRLQGLYGDLVCQLMAAAYPQWSEHLPLPILAPGERVRVAFVSAFVERHSVWATNLRGFVQNLDRTRFAVTLCHTGSRRDDETDAARAMADRFVAGPMEFEDWCRTIRAAAPHVLIYPDVAVDRTSLKLAALRLAPLQCVTWGHPITSGLPTIDAFLSGERLEPPGAREHYTETLVCLPGTASCYAPYALPHVAAVRADFGLPDDAVLLACCQTPFKYVPFYDDVLIRIARAAPQARFVFFRPVRDAQLFDRLMARLARCFAAAGLARDAHCIVLPHLDGARFEAALRVMDGYLDSVGFSSFNVAIHGIRAGLPIVTVRAGRMRGRLASALLETAGVPDTIADDIDGYVEVAVRLCADIEWRASLRARLAAGMPRIFHDLAPVRALEAFILSRLSGSDVTGTSHAPA